MGVKRQDCALCLPFSDWHRQKVNPEEYAYHGKKISYILKNSSTSTSTLVLSFDLRESCSAGLSPRVKWCTAQAIGLDRNPQVQKLTHDASGRLNKTREPVPIAALAHVVTFHSIGPSSPTGPRMIDSLFLSRLKLKTTRSVVTPNIQPNCKNWITQLGN